MPIGTIAENIALAGISIQSSITRTASGQISHELTLPAAKAGTLSTRTSDTAGTATLGSGHGISDGDVVDIYWDGGVAYGATVGTVVGTSVPFTGAGGDALPAQDTAITMSKQVEINTDFDGDDMEMLAVVCTKRGHIHFQEEDNTGIAAKELLAQEGWTWASDTGASNPLTGDLYDCRVGYKGLGRSTKRLGGNGRRHENRLDRFHQLGSQPLGRGTKNHRQGRGLDYR